MSKIFNINTSINIGGRFGNILFLNFIADYISRKINLKFIYKNYDEIKKLGINLHKGTQTYYTNYILDDTNIDTIFKEVKKNNILINGYFQTPTVSLYIKNRILELKEIIIKKNPYNYINNFLFVHVRLGDIITNNIQEDYSYYDSTISKINYYKGYISSDSIEHEYCQKLIKKYNLIEFKNDEVSTIQFGSTCKNIVLSKGTFSWWIGVLSFGSSVWFPEKNNLKPWHGDIFVFPEWNKVIY